MIEGGDEGGPEVMGRGVQMGTRDKGGESYSHRGEKAEFHIRTRHPWFKACLGYELTG